MHPACSANWITLIRYKLKNTRQWGFSFRILLLFLHSKQHVSQDRAVGIVTIYWLDDRGIGVRVPSGIKNFHFSMSSSPALGYTQRNIQWAPGALSPWVKRPGREDDHSQTSAQVKKRGSIHPLSYTHSWRSPYLVKFRDNFTITFTRRG
jgi:hypothetical protein